MCGPSGSENSLQNQSETFASQLQSNYGTLFGNELNTLNAINRSLSPTLAAGPNQEGFSGAELASMQTQAINTAAAANEQAQQAARTYGAGQGGGGTSGITSGVTKQIEAAIASQSEGQLAQQENQITQANYQAGNANYWRAVGGAQALASGYSPNAAQGGAISENAQSFGQANAINQQNQELQQTIAGAATSLGMGAASFINGGINAPAGQSFLAGGLNALAG